MLKLMKYEFRKDLSVYLVLIGMLVAAELYFLMGFMFNNSVSVGIAAFIFIMGGMVGIIALMIQGALSYSKELSSKYSFMTFMTPNSPYKIIGAKYLSLFTVTAVSSVAYVGFCILDITLIYSKFDDVRAVRDIVRTACRMVGWDTDAYVAALIAMLVTMWLGFFFSVSCAYLAITLSATILENKKGKGFLSFVFFIVIEIVVSKINDIIPRLDIKGGLGEAILNNIFVYLFEIVAIFLSYLWVSHMLEKKISL